MDGVVFHLIQRESVPPEESHQGRHREVAVVLMVNGIKLAMFDQILNIGNLDDGQAVLLQQGADAFNQPVAVRDVRQDIVGDDDVRPFPFVPQSLGELFPEKGAQGGNASRLSGFSRSLGRVDAQDWNALLHEAPKHISIIAGDLHYEATAIELLRVDQPQRVLPRMLQQGIGEGGEVGIAATDQRLPRDGFQNLHQGAVPAEGHVQRGFGFRLAQLLLGEQGVRQRALSQRQNYR